MNLSGNDYPNYHFQYGSGNSMQILLHSDWNRFGGNTPDAETRIEGNCGHFDFSLPKETAMYLKPN
jgi:1,4-alpha-glucan branching enzyme